MLDFGWSELMLIAAVTVFVVGPKDLPKILYGLGRVVRRMQYVRFAVSRQFDELLQAGDIEELRKGVNFETARPGHDPAAGRETEAARDADVEAEAEADADEIHAREMLPLAAADIHGDETRGDAVNAAEKKE